MTDVEVVRLDVGRLRPPARARSRPRARDAARPRPDPRAAPADGQRGDRGPARRLTVRPVVAAVRAWLDGGGSRGGDVHAQDAVGGRGARGRVGRPVRGGRGDPAGVHEDRVAGQLRRAGLRPALLRRRRRRRSRSWDGIPIDVSVAFPPAPAAGPDGPYPVIGIYHGWGGSKLSLAGADAQRALDPRLRRVHDDRPRLGPVVRRGRRRATHAAARARATSGSCTTRTRCATRSTLLGQLADDGVIDPQKIGATGGSYGGGMSIALGALRNRMQLPNGTLVPWTSPLGKPMAIAATVPEFTWSDLADGAEPERQLARLRRRRAVPRRRPPRSASRSRAGTTRCTSAALALGLLRAGRAPIRRPTSSAGRR